MSYADTLTNDALTESYDDIKKLLYKIAHGFAHSRNVPFEELRSVVDTAFVKAYAGYTPDRGSKLSSWAAFVALCDVRTYLKRTHRYRNWLELNEAIVGTEDHNTFLLALRSEVSKDANHIIDLLVDSNSDMQTLLRWNDARRKTNVLRVIREHLADLGWEQERMEAALREISRALRPVHAVVPRCAPDPDLRRLGIEREDVWLMARTGLSRTDVRLLLTT